jgi:hypothetical protein
VTEIIRPVLARYNRALNDPAIRGDILSDLRTAISSGALDLLFLVPTLCVNALNLRIYLILLYFF